MALHTFKIARVEEDELPSMTELTEPTGDHKTIYVIGETEEEAVKKAETYVANTKFADIEDKKLIR